MRFLFALTLLAISLFLTASTAHPREAPKCPLCARNPDIRTDLGPRLSPAATIRLRSDNSTLFNQATHRYTITHPDIIAFVSVGAADDVSIKYAIETGREILAGNSGHGWSTTLNRVRDAIMIDISPLSDISIDAAANTVTIGGGVRIGALMAALQAAGKETPTGICDPVGVLGATLGGGHGRLQGRHGLIIDNILSAQLTTATGETVTVSNTSNPDLFWALRGAGHNFGIVTEATFHIYDAVNGGMQFMAVLFYDTALIPELFEAINDFDLPAETNVLVSFFMHPVLKVPQMVLNFVSSAPEDIARSQFESAFGHIPYLSRNESVIPWADVNGHGPAGTGDAGPTPARLDMSGVSIMRYDIPSILFAFEKYKEFAAVPGTGGALIMFESDSVKGVQAVPAESTAYPWRAASGFIMLSAGWDSPSLDGRASDWLYETMAILHAGSGFERPAVYSNIAHGTEGFGAMYGYEEWRQTKLKDLKKRWDPGCMFSGYNPIPIDCY